MGDLFFNLSKIFWVLAQPDHFLLLMLLLGLILWRRLLGVILVWGSVLLLLVISAYPVANYLLEPLEQRFPQPDLAQLEAPIKGIIVLGGGENAEKAVLHGRPEFDEGADRLMAVPQLLQRYPDIKVVFTGGSGSVLRPEYRGGDVAQQWLQAQGLEDRVLIERESRNTYQNAVLTRALMEQEGLDLSGNWLLVTSAFHMPRSVGVYQQVGIKVVPYPVDYRSIEYRFRPDQNKNMSDLNTAVREWIGLAVYHLTDKTPEWLPGPENL